MKRFFFYFVILFSMNLSGFPLKDSPKNSITTFCFILLKGPPYEAINVITPYFDKKENMTGDLITEAIETLISLSSSEKHNIVIKEELVRYAKSRGYIIVEIGPEFLRIEDLIPYYLKDIRKDVERGIEALNTGDFGAIEKNGYSMKLSGKRHGFLWITKMGYELESAAFLESSEEIREILDKLSNYLKRVVIIFPHWAGLT